MLREHKIRPGDDLSGFFLRNCRREKKRKEKKERKKEIQSKEEREEKKEEVLIGPH